MGDLELLRAFRAETPELADARLRAIRDAYRVATPSPRMPRPAWRRIVVLASATAIVAGVLLAVALTRGQERAAAAVLRHAAARLDDAPRPTLPVGSYWYIRTRERTLGITSYPVDGENRTAAAFTSETGETWLANDGSGAQYGMHGAPQAITDAGRRALAELQRVQPSTDSGGGTVYAGPTLLAVSLGSRTLDPANLAALPADPDALGRLIEDIPLRRDGRASAHAVAFAEFESISNALFFEPFDPRVGAALYRVLATLPDVERLGTVQDGAGRTGVAVAIDNGTSRWSLIVDTGTGGLLERTETKIAATSSAEDAQVPVGTVTWRQTILGTAVVAGIATRPDGSTLDTSGWTVCTPDPQPGSPHQGHCVDPPAPSSP